MIWKWCNTSVCISPLPVAGLCGSDSNPAACLPAAVIAAACSSRANLISRQIAALRESLPRCQGNPVRMIETSPLTLKQIITVFQPLSSNSTTLCWNKMLLIARFLLCETRARCVENVGNRHANAWEIIVDMFEAGTLSFSGKKKKKQKTGDNAMICCHLEIYFPFHIHSLNLNFT